MAALLLMNAKPLHSGMDYRIRRESSDLDSTGYVEIGPGKYSGKHWQAGFLFIWEDAFGMAEGIVAKHVPKYDHFSMTDLPSEVGRKVIADWRAAAEQLPAMTVEQASAALNPQASYRAHMDGEIESHRAEIAGMLRDLADACTEFYDREAWVCILGI